MAIAVITPDTPCSRTGSSYIISGKTNGFLASQTTEDTGCGLTETPWIIQASSVIKSNKMRKLMWSIDTHGLMDGFSIAHTNRSPFWIREIKRRAICSTWSPGNALFWGQKVKGQGHDVCVGLQTECSIAVAAAYVSYAGFSCNAPPHKHRDFPASVAAEIYVHFGLWSLRSSITSVLFGMTEVTKDRTDSVPSVLRTDLSIKGPIWLSIYEDITYVRELQTVTRTANNNDTGRFPCLLKM